MLTSDVNYMYGQLRMHVGMRMTWCFPRNCITVDVKKNAVFRASTVHAVEYACQLLHSLFLTPVNIQADLAAHEAV